MKADSITTSTFYVFASDEGVSGSNPSRTPSEGDSPLYTESVSSGSDHSIYEQISITNCLLVGIILFIGVFFGAFCMSHLFNRIRKD